MRLAALYTTSILAGFCMMALEIMGGRLLQPVFGSSIDVWAAIITVFILSLSVGYVLGGRIADRARTNFPLGWILVAAGLCYLVIPVVALPFMNALPEAIQHARWGVLLAGLVLFLPPSLLLGMVSPILVRLVFVGADRVGRSTGTLYAIGSFGNVVGILVSDYVLLQAFELNDSIWAMGGVLSVLGIAHLAKRVAADATSVPATAPVGAAVAGAGA